uniref:Cyclin-like domain-containing protein n=1 Tax=Panagrolaimus superbus TaxID=310955 RepID=A0A914ZCV7_9BILA
MDVTRRRKILTSIDDNVVASKTTFGKAFKEVKKVGLSLRPNESKTLTKLNVKGKPEIAPKKQKEAVDCELPKVASLALFKNAVSSKSYINIDCFDDGQKFLLYTERCRAIPPIFLENKIISGKMRAILFDWMLQVQDRFNLEHDTLHLGYMMVDRCLRTMDIKKDKLQLLGATCLFIATKYEEVSIPHITDFVYLAASAFTKRDIMAMERKVFQAVNFNMGFAYPIHFLRRYRYALQNKDDTHDLSKCFLDLFMSIYELANKLPSIMAQVSLYISYFVSGKKLPAEVYSLMAITEKELKKECTDFVDHILIFCTTPKETTLHRKYRLIKPRLSESQHELLKTLKLH